MSYLLHYVHAYADCSSIILQSKATVLNFEVLIQATVENSSSSTPNLANTVASSELF
jgi:hypothetical protein